jgi:hypothetical protein
MLKRVIFLGLAIRVLVADGSSIDSLNLKYMYEGAKEIEMLNRSMEAGMREHNQVEKPILTKINENLIDNSHIDTFEDFGDRYILEKSIKNGAEVKTTLIGDTLRIEIKISNKETIVTENGIGESSISSVTTEEIPIPSDGDISRLKKEYSNGTLRVEVPKRGK